MTPFVEIYDIFLHSLKSDDLIDQWMEDPETVEAKFYDMLMTSAIVHFKGCNKDLTKHDDTSFNAELNEEEKRILALGMKYEYLSTVVIPNENLVRDKFYTKDYQWFSPNAKMKNLLTVEENTKRNLKNAIRLYQYYNKIRGV